MFFKILFDMVLLGMIMLAIGIYDGNRFIVVKNTFANDKIKNDFKFALISDLHNRCYGKDNCKVLEVLEKEKPDAILIAGDLLTSKRNQHIDTTITIMREMCKRWPVYYSMGNHETKLKLYADSLGNQFEKFIGLTKSDNRILLQNEHVYLDEYNVDICGLELERSYFKRFVSQKVPIQHLKDLIGEPNREACQILLAHNPDYFEDYVSWGADMIFSGHVHGGIMRLPILGGVIAPSLRLFPKYDGGIFRKEKALMLLSRGLGVHSIPLRFFNPAELHIVTLKRPKD